MGEENVTRVQHQGLLYRYVPESFFKSAHWKESWAVLHGNNATLYVHKDENVNSKKAAELDLKTTVLWMAFGQDAYKYRSNAPKFPHPDEILDKSLADNLIAVPKDKNCDQVTWLAAKDRATLREWIWHLAKCLKAHSNPPMLSSKRGDEERIKKGVIRNFGLTGNEEEWEIYWLNNLWQAEQKLHNEKATQGSSAIKVDQIGILEKAESHLTEYPNENVDPRSMAEMIFQPRRVSDQWDNEFRPGKDSDQKISYYVTELDNGWKKTEIIIDVPGSTYLKPAVFTEKSHDVEAIDIKILRKYGANLYDYKGDHATPICHMIEKISQF